MLISRLYHYVMRAGSSAQAGVLSSITAIAGAPDLLTQKLGVGAQSSVFLAHLSGDPNALFSLQITNNLRNWYNFDLKTLQVLFIWISPKLDILLTSLYFKQKATVMH